MPRFVVLQHDHPERLHWDFMLDQDTTLATWALPLPPAFDHVLSTQRLADHRREYLDYEGPVSQGRGHVVRWDEGEFMWLENGPDHIVVELKGKKIAGRVSIRAADDSPGTYRWHLKSVSR